MTGTTVPSGIREPVRCTVIAPTARASSGSHTRVPPMSARGQNAATLGPAVYARAYADPPQRGGRAGGGHRDRSGTAGRHAWPVGGAKRTETGDALDESYRWPKGWREAIRRRPEPE
jgi:hypothetical protein